MVKQQGSLGFTLRKEDESVLGHYVRALVREPATTDGRIKPGDKIVAVSFVFLYYFFSWFFLYRIHIILLPHTFMASAMFQIGRFLVINSVVLSF